MDTAKLHAFRDGRDTEAFTFHLIGKASPSDAAQTQRLLSAYDCWHSIWKQTLHELDGVDSIASDEFTRQDEVGAIFHLEECIAVTCLRWIDLSLLPHQHDSYFSMWSADARKRLRAFGKRVLIASHLGVRPEWRGTAASPSIKEALTILGLKRFRSSAADVLAATVRNNRGMNRLMYRFGARALQHGAMLHGVAVDLIAFERRAVSFGAPESDVEKFAADLWEGSAGRRTP